MASAATTRRARRSRNSPNDLAGGRGAVYEMNAGTREQEMATLSWPESQKAGFLRVQFNVQLASYQHESSTLNIAIAEGN